MISGEWSVLFDQHCIAVPVNRGVSVRVRKREDQVIVVHSDLFDDLVEYVIGPGGCVESKIDDSSHRFVYHALQKSLLYVSQLGVEMIGFELDIFSSDNEGNSMEIESGFGSSAAVAASVVKAVFSCFEIPMSSFEDLLAAYKISYLAHFEAQEKRGSGYDVAISVFEKPLYYKRPFEDFVNEEHENILDFVLIDWDGLEIVEIDLPKEISIFSKHVGTKASTQELILGVMGECQKNEEAVFEIIQKIEGVTQKLFDASQNSQPERFLKLISQNNALLKEFSALTGDAIFIDAYRPIEELVLEKGGAFKFSGAGGGDQVIAVFSGEIDGLTDFKKIV